MSAQELTARSLRQLDILRHRHAATLNNTRFRPLTSAASGLTPASSAEEIAMQTIELTASIRAFTQAMEVIKEEMSAMERPDKKDQESQEISDPQQAEKEKGAY